MNLICSSYEHKKIHLPILPLLSALLLAPFSSEALYGGGVWPCINCDTSSIKGCAEEQDQVCLDESAAAFPIREILQPDSALYADLQTLEEDPDEGLYLDLAKLNTPSKKLVSQKLKSKLLKVANEIKERCGVGILVRGAFVQGSKTEKRRYLYYEGRSAQIKFKTKPTSCRIPVQNKRFDICYAPEDETSEIAQDENSQGCPFSFCTVDGQGGKCHEVSGAGICTKDCKQQNTVCETPDIDAENECNAEIKKFGAVPTTGVKDREGNTLEQGTYGFCKTKRSASSDPKKYKGLSGLGRTEAEVGMLADIAIQQGFDHVKRQGDYVQVAVTPDVCQVQLDAIFVLDGSASITAPDWEATKDVVKSFIDRFDIKGASAEGEEVTRVGAVGYSRDVFIDSAFQLSKYKENAEAAKCAINAIRRTPAETSTGGALAYVHDTMLTEQNGMRADAKRIPRVVILITDGEPTDRTTQASANKLKEKGAEFYVIFIAKNCDDLTGQDKNLCEGSAKSARDLFKARVSKPVDKHFFELSGIDFVPSLVGEISQSLCTQTIDLAPCCSETSMDWVSLEPGYFQYFSTPCSDTSAVFKVIVEAESAAMKFEVYVLLETDDTSESLPGPLDGQHDEKSTDVNQRVKTLRFTAPKSKTLKIAVRGQGAITTKIRLRFELDYSAALIFDDLRDRELGPEFEIGSEDPSIATIEIDDDEFTSFDKRMVEGADNLLDTVSIPNSNDARFFEVKTRFGDRVDVKALPALQGNVALVDDGTMSATLYAKGKVGAANECAVASKSVDVFLLAPGATRANDGKTVAPRTTRTATTRTARITETSTTTTYTTKPGDTTSTKTTTTVEDPYAGYSINYVDDDDEAAAPLASLQSSEECADETIATGFANALTGPTAISGSSDAAVAMWKEFECYVSSLPSTNGTAVIMWYCTCNPFNPLWLLLLLLCCCIPCCFFCTRRALADDADDPSEANMTVPAHMSNPMFDATAAYGDGADPNSAFPIDANYLEPTGRQPIIAAVATKPRVAASKRPNSAARLQSKRAAAAAPPPVVALPPPNRRASISDALAAAKRRPKTPKTSSSSLTRAAANSQFIIPDDSGIEKIYDDSGSMLRSALPVPVPPPAFKVTVVTPDGQRLNIEADPDDTLGDIGEQVEDAAGVSPVSGSAVYPAESARFSLAGEVLPVDTLDTLADHGIRNGDVIHLLPMKVFVKDAVRGKTYTLDVTPDTTIEGVKALLGKKSRSRPADTQRLQFDSADLEDGAASLKDLGIKDQDTILLMPMQLRVKDMTKPRGETYTVDVNPADSIADIKARVEEVAHTPAASQRLEHYGKKLNNDTANLKDCNIKHLDTLNLMPMQIMVQDASGPAGQIHTLDVAADDTIGSIKAKVEELTGKPAAKQKLQFNGVGLDVDNETLNSVGIRHMDTLVLMPEPARKTVFVPLKFSKSHMIGVRLEDKVIHHPLVPTDDGKGIQLITANTDEPTFGWLPDLITHYSCDRHCSPFTLHNEVVGYPSLASTSRMEWLEVRSEVLEREATQDALDDSENHDAMFDAMFNNLFDEVLDHVLDGSSHDGALALHRPGWVDSEGGAAEWDSSKSRIESHLRERSAPVSELGLDRAVDRVLQSLMQSIPEHIFEEVLDKYPANRGEDADFNETLIWDHDYQEVHPWYIPDMTRSEVTEALSGMGMGEFIVYERLDQKERPGRPESFPAPPIRQFDTIGLPTNDDSSDDEAGFVPRKKGGPENGEPIPPSKSKKMLPKAFRLDKQTRVIRRGQELVAFKDDNHLDVEIDQHTRMVVGKKESATPGKSYGKRMFPGLNSKDGGDDDGATVSEEIQDFLHSAETAGGAGHQGARPLRLRSSLADADGFEDDDDIDIDAANSNAVVGTVAPYTHGFLSRSEAQDRLENAAVANPTEAEGMFLVRGSEKIPNGFVLNFLNAGTFKNMLFKMEDGGYTCNGIEFVASSLDALIRQLVGGHPDMAKLSSYVTVRNAVGNNLDAVAGDSGTIKGNLRRKASVYLGFGNNGEAAEDNV